MTTVLVFAVAAVAISPLLAAWTVGLTAPRGSSPRWWQPRLVAPRRLLAVAVIAALLAVAAAVGAPPPAWWLFAAGGTVLVIVDLEHHLLPARIVYPLATAVAAALGATAIATGKPESLLRAVIAAAVVGAGWFTVAFVSPTAMGLGDVRVASLTAGLLGWMGWTAVLAGQILALGIATLTAGVIAVTTSKRGRALQVPMGPALVLGALIAGWLPVAAG